MIVPGHLHVWIILVGFLSKIGITQCLALLSTKNNNNIIVRIQVCQNKSCCQRFSGRATNLVQTLRQVTTRTTPMGSASTSTATAQQQIIVESSPCLSHCELGPNLVVHYLHQQGITSSMETQIEHGVSSVTAAAAVLELIDDGFQVPSTLLAAWKVLEQAHQPGTFHIDALMLSVSMSCINVYMVVVRWSFSITFPTYGFHS